MENRKQRWVFAAAVAAAVVAVAAVFVVHGWNARRRAAAAAAERQAFLAKFGIVSDGTQPFVALPPCLPHGALQARLGQEMFCERRLARTSHRTCGACHLLNEGGTDGKLHGGVLTRPALNAVFAPVYLHDGSISNLQGLVARMVESPDFGGAESLEKAVLKLAADEKILARFRETYADGLTPANVVDCLVQHCYTLVTGNMPFDRYCGGRADALDPVQKKGMALFQERKCLSCHDGPALGTMKVSEGRKVPSLRGISRRRVFLTDGTRGDLGAVLSLMPGGDLEPEERAALVSFLKAL